MIIRTATMDDLSKIASVERQCFPQAEAATEDLFRSRLQYYPDYFRLLFDEDRLVAFVDGFVTDIRDLTDIMYEDASMHDPDGAWQMIFGVNTVPEYRRKGLAALLIRNLIEDAGKEGREGVVLTCKKELIPYYSRFGFVNEGITSKSVHGGVSWYQMRLTF